MSTDTTKLAVEIITDLENKNRVLWSRANDLFQVLLLAQEALNRCGLESEGPTLALIETTLDRHSKK